MRKLAAFSMAFALASVLAVRADDEKEKDKKLDTPEKCLEAYKKAALAADGKSMMKCFSPATKKALIAEAEKALKQAKESAEGKAETAKNLGVTAEQFDAMTPEDFMAAQMAAGAREDNEQAEKTTFAVVKTDGDRSVATVDEGKGKKEKIVLLKTDGEWGMDMEESEKLKNEGAEEEGSGK